MTLDRFESDANERGRAYAAMLANISDVIALIDREGFITFKSANIRTIFGWNPEDLVGRPAFEKVHPDDRPEIQREFMALIREPERVITGACRYQHADGTYRWMRFTAANKLNDPVLQGVLLNYRDITEERKIHERFRVTFEAAPAGMILADNSNQIIEANRAAELILGYGEGELTGMNGRDIIPSDELQEHPIELVTEKVLNERVPLEIENKFRTKSGGCIDVTVRVSRIELDDPSISHIVQFFDISRRKQAEERVQALLAEKELLLREVHHRIKNDLGLVSSLLSTQARTAGKDAAEALREAGYRVGVMARVYERLQGVNSLDDISVSTVIDGLVYELKHGLIPDVVSIRTEIEELNLPARLCVSLGIIVNELITNAVKHAFDGAAGDVFITVVREIGDALRLTVRDTGSGFPEDVLSGTQSGYGFMIAQALAEQHDGKLVLSNDGGGVVDVVVTVAKDS